MLLLAVAMVALTLFLVWVTSTIKDCYTKACHYEYQMFGTKGVAWNSSFYKNDEDFCYNLLRNSVSGIASLLAGFPGSVAVLSNIREL